jgi:hypothetical protein
MNSVELSKGKYILKGDVMLIENVLRSAVCSCGNLGEGLILETLLLLLLLLLLLFGSQMAVRLSALRAGRPLPPGRFLVLMYVRG